MSFEEFKKKYNNFFYRFYDDAVIVGQNYLLLKKINKKSAEFLKDYYVNLVNERRKTGTKIQIEEKILKKGYSAYLLMRKKLMRSEEINKLLNENSSHIKKGKEKYMNEFIVFFR